MRVVRVITRLNVGGPAIQAITLADRLTARGIDTVLVHGQLDASEGDMRYLLPVSVAVREVQALRRPLTPVHDAVALARLLQILRDFRPHIVHTHMAKAGTIGRLAAAIYNRTAGRRALARVVHTYHGHVLEGYFSPAKTRMFLGIERGLARLTDCLVAISPEIRTELLEETAHRLAATSTASSRLDSSSVPLSSIDDTRPCHGPRSNCKSPPIRHVVFHGWTADRDQESRAVPGSRPVWWRRGTGGPCS